MSAHAFTFDGIDGRPISLAEYRGKAVLIVNTASECGFTPQYAGLQALWETYRDRGLVVVGIPSNDFGHQEPGEEPAIQAFCSRTYGVAFPLTAKYAVLGSEAHPFFRWLEDQAGEGFRPRWNFHKYLIGPGGELLAGWPAKIAPQSAEIVQAIESALAK